MRQHCKTCYAVGTQPCFSSFVSITTSWKNSISFLVYPFLFWVFIYHNISRKRLGIPDIPYSEHNFLSPPDDPDNLLPYTIMQQSRGVVPYRASRPVMAFYPADVSLSLVYNLRMLTCLQHRKFDASTQTADFDKSLEVDSDKTLTDIEPINTSEAPLEGGELIVKKRKCSV